MAHCLLKRVVQLNRLNGPFLVRGKKGDVGEQKNIIFGGEVRLEPTEEAEPH